MKVVYNAKNNDLDPSKKVYECGWCKKLFNWDENSMWYGTLKQWDECSDELIYSCCQEHADEIEKREKK